MREPKYLSPTSISLYYKDRREFYLNYLADNRPPRPPQTKPMSIGSAFDAFVKNYLVYALHGSVDPAFEIETIFEAQVEPHNRDWAFEQGEHVFKQYKESGALADLMIELEQACEEPQFEFTVEGRVSHETHKGGIPLLGKPDVYFKTKGGNPVILDWKVNGYCATRPKSPAKGYLKLRDATSKTGKMHKDCQPMMIDGINVNIAHYLEDVDKTWADQTAIYLWIIGEPVGTKAIVGIDQLCGQGDGRTIKVATHRERVSKPYQLGLLERIKEVWTAIQLGTVIVDPMERKQLDDYYLAYHESTGSGNVAWDEWFQESTRKAF